MGPHKMTKRQGCTNRPYAAHGSAMIDTIEHVHLALLRDKELALRELSEARTRQRDLSAALEVRP